MAPRRTGLERRPISILVASGDRPVLRMVSRFLAAFPGVIVVGLADTMIEAMERASALDPDVLLLDSNLMTLHDDIGRLEYRRRLRTEVIALVDSTDRLAGADAFAFVVTKSRLAAELMACIHRAADAGARQNRVKVTPREARAFEKDSQ